MGRSKTSEPRSRQLNLSLTESELAGIERRAAALGLRPAHYGRSLVLGTEQPSAKKAIVSDNGARLIHAQLVRLGNNLNQLVRHLNRTGDPLPADLEPLLADIRRMIVRGTAGEPR